MPTSETRKKSRRHEHPTSWLEELPSSPKPGSDEEALVLATFMDYLNEDIESPKARDMRNKYSKDKFEHLASMMDAVMQLKCDMARIREVESATSSKL